MKSDYQLVDLNTINKGAIGDLFDRELKQVLQNIEDENTSPKATRTITIKVKFKPTEDRSRATTEVEVKSSLASVKPHEHYVVIGIDRNQVRAFVTDPREQDLPFDGSNITPIGGVQ